MRRVMGLLALAMLAGCASYGDLRAKAPAFTEVVAGTPKGIADCTLDGMQRRYGDYTFQKMEVGDLTHISAQINGLSGPMNYLYVLTFAPAGDGNTRVEVRADTNVWGRPYAGIPVLDVVRSCQRAA